LNPGEKTPLQGKIQIKPAAQFFPGKRTHFTCQSPATQEICPLSPEFSGGRATQGKPVSFVLDKAMDFIKDIRYLLHFVKDYPVIDGRDSD
jgi:hypothetical protein